MGHFKVLKLLILGFLILFYSCGNKFINKAYDAYKEGVSAFVRNFDKSDLFKHFPKKLDNNFIRYGIFPPSRNGQSNSGYIYLLNHLDSSIELRNDFVMMQYSDSSNTIIDLPELKLDVFPAKKCNELRNAMNPIPYFEKFNFGLGEYEEKKIVKGEPHFNYTYDVPHDLKVYVIEAKSGYYWKNGIVEKRPEDLKEWKNGYSRGIAISEKEKLILYWTIVWQLY